MSEGTPEDTPRAGVDRLKKALTAGLLLFVGVAVAAVVVQEVQGGDESEYRPPAPVVVYYFHGNYRCTTCNTIQRLTQETVAERFAPQVQQGRLAMRTVNVDEPGNRHFAREYELETRTVVIAEFDEAGEREDWEKLMKVWKLYDRPEEFKDYVESEIEQRLRRERPAEEE
jgi:hypothetical protein